jgi:ABC-type Fe3+-hydroxamate transport system substrate-binding protein
MKIPALKIVLAITLGGLVVSGSHNSSSASSQPTGLQPGTLCAKNERVIFSCPVKRPARIVSLCGSKDLTSDRGYLQYRFGVPEKVELEFPQSKTGTQQKFQYTHYFRAQVDLTEISFSSNGYEYQITDDYNGEEKPAQISQGVSVTAPGKPKDVNFVCRTKPKADYTDLQAVLSSGQ